jgi:hypothetical protein
MDDGETKLAAALQKSTAMLLNGSHVPAPLPPIPSEVEWAESVARYRIEDPMS